jgi:hypothetical protein
MSAYSEEQLSSGPSASTDPTLVTGQYPVSLFGSPLPQTTGAGGTEGAPPAGGGQPVDFTDGWGSWRDRPTALQQLSGPGDSTTLPGQTSEGISGLGPADVASTGAGLGSANQHRHPNAGGGR